jgi:AcrR family transcriptional regulator
MCCGSSSYWKSSPRREKQKGKLFPPAKKVLTALGKPGYIIYRRSVYYLEGMYMKNAERTEARKNEILDTAERLFMERGYEQTTISDILSVSGIAKGSLYYHYTSKEDVLDGVLRRITAQIVAAAKAVADDSTMPAHEKMLRVIPSVSISESPNERMIQELHSPANALLHQKSIAQTIRAVAPVIAGIVEQGIREGVYHTRYPLETVEILLVAGQFIFDEGIFQWTPDEMAAKMTAFIHITETVLGVEEGSFQFLSGGHTSEK